MLRRKMVPECEPWSQQESRSSTTIRRVCGAVKLTALLTPSFIEMFSLGRFAMRIAHHVYFTLIDSSKSKVEEQLAACKKFLDNHSGVELFDIGVLNPDLARPVNDRAYDVSLHVVFTDKAAHDRYQTDPRHLQFIAQQKPNWKQVRVFDSDLCE